MILGFLVIVALFVIRFSEATPIAVPDRITLPDGTIPMAYTKGNGWYAVVTADNQILIFDAQSGVMRQTIEIRQRTGTPVLFVEDGKVVGVVGDEEIYRGMQFMFNEERLIAEGGSSVGAGAVGS